MLPVDLTIGDALTVRRRAVEHLACPSSLDVSFDRDMTYDDCKGLTSFVDLIEDANPGWRAIVTCGAMHGLNVVVRAMQESSFSEVHLGTPVWKPISDILAAHRMTKHPLPDFGVASHLSASSFYLLVAPNNPDGSVPDQQEVATIRSTGMPIVHDAVYAHPHYYNEGEPVEIHGDIVIRSVSKMLGMSGLRVGFILCRDSEMAEKLREIVDTTTSGTSSLSQRYAFGMLSTYWNDLRSRKSFEMAVQRDLREARTNMEDAVARFVRSPVRNYRGMFGWYDMDPAILDSIRVKHISGAGFGCPEFVRLNLAAGENRIRFACDRIRSL